MAKGEIAELATSLFQELRDRRGDIGHDLALQKAREIAPTGISPERVVDRMERSYAAHLQQRGYYS